MTILFVIYFFLEKNLLSVQVFDESGKQVTLADFFKKDMLLVYFYPKDNTPGCTTEACNFRDANSEIRSMGVDIVGISKDSADSHRKFKERNNLNFVLLSDPQHKLQEAFDVWKEKSFMGRKFIGTERSTFLVAKDGRILKEWRNVKANKHKEEVLEYLRTLKH